MATKAERKTKTNHDSGWHKPVRNPTTNYPPDSHKTFCRRCLSANDGFCPITKTDKVSRYCEI